MVPADCVPGPEPGDGPPRVVRQPQEDARRVGAGHRGGQGQLDPGRGRILGELLDHRHPLAAHADRGQHGERAVPGRRAFGHPGQRLLPAPTSQYRAPGPSPPSRWPSRACWNPAQAPSLARHRQNSGGPVGPRAQALHRVVQCPGERGLADAFPAVAGHPAGHVRPARDHGQQPAALGHGHAVAFLEPQRAQHPGVKLGQARRVLGVPSRHDRGLARRSLGRVGHLRGRPVIGDPHGGDDRRLVVHVGRGGRAVVLHHQAAAAVRAVAAEQDVGPSRPGRETSVSPAPAQRRHAPKRY